VWYKNDKKSPEKAAGFAYTWNHAKQMAEGLYAIKKKVDKQEDAITGISLFDCGELYTVAQPKQKWQILPILVVITSSIIKIK
jgi:hypothetical protein